VRALKNFYDQENEGYTVDVYVGNVRWFNLMMSENFKKFRQVFEKHGINIVNSDMVGKVIRKMGYDGIRYYDILATGEEFVLFNESVLRKIKEL
jgi:hypothetical protein